VHRNSGIIVVIMDTFNSITAAVFIAFLKCPTKAHLLAIRDPAPATYFTDIEARISLMYKSAAMRSLRVGAEMAEPLDFGELLSSHGHEVLAHPVDKTAIYNSVLSSHEPGGCQSRKSTPSSAPNLHHLGLRLDVQCWPSTIRPAATPFCSRRGAFPIRSTNLFLEIGRVEIFSLYFADLATNEAALSSINFARSPAT
jgi:hypothetical protein